MCSSTVTFFGKWSPSLSYLLSQTLIKHHKYIKYLLSSKGFSLIYQLKVKFLIYFFFCYLFAASGLLLSECSSILLFIYLFTVLNVFLKLKQKNSEMSSRWSSVLWQSVCSFVVLQNLVIICKNVIVERGITIEGSSCRQHLHRKG